MDVTPTDVSGLSLLAAVPSEVSNSRSLGKPISASLALPSKIVLALRFTHALAAIAFPCSPPPASKTAASKALKSASVLM